MKKLVVIPSEPIRAYEDKGTSSWLEEYFNPNFYFDEVYVLSPKEKIDRQIYGLKIISISSDRQFRKLLKTINPICVRAYGGYWATDYANYNRVGQIPVVSSIHDTNPKLLFKGVKFSDDYFVMSNAIKKVLNSVFCINDIKILGNRVDTELFKRIDKASNHLLKDFDEKKIILHVGRKSYEKNIETVIKSVSLLSEDYLLVLIGMGNNLKYKALATELNILDNIFFLEKVENEELVYWYNLADVLCVPSRWEGFGLVFVEAACCLTKIVTSNIEPINEYLLNDGEMNILVDDYENPVLISKAIAEITSINSVNNNTRDFIVNKFDKGVVSKKELSFYNEVKYSYRSKTIEYKLWRIEYKINRDVVPRVKKIIKLPRRIWKKIISYL